MDQYFKQLESYRRAYLDGAITLHEYMLAVARVAMEWMEANPVKG